MSGFSSTLKTRIGISCAWLSLLKSYFFDSSAQANRLHGHRTMVHSNESIVFQVFGHGILWRCRQIGWVGLEGVYLLTLMLMWAKCSQRMPEIYFYRGQALTFGVVYFHVFSALHDFVVAAFSIPRGGSLFDKLQKVERFECPGGAIFNDRWEKHWKRKQAVYDMATRWKSQFFSRIFWWCFLLWTSVGSPFSVSPSGSSILQRSVAWQQHSSVGWGGRTVV